MEIYYNTFKLFNKDIPFYGLTFVLGFTIAIITAMPKAKKYSLPGVEIVVSAVFAGLGGVFGAKILAIITAIPSIAEYYASTGTIPWLQLLQSGFVFYGGLIGGTVGLFLYCKIYKFKFAEYSDLYAGGTALGHAVGRVGCLFSGCCYGIETSGNFYVLYHSSIDSSTPLNVRLLPTALIETMYLAIIFIMCEIIFYKTKKAGNSTILYALCYSVARFVLEFFRGDTVRGLLFGISTSQYISILIFALCITIIAIKFIRHKTTRHS